MKKKLKTSLFYHAACVSLALMAVLLAFAACKDEPEPLSGANNITSFKIGDRGGAITRTRGETELVDQDRISVVVPAATSLGSVSPVIAISSAATVSPASGEAVDLTHPFTYVVTAENGNQRFYTVTAVPEDAEVVVVLESIYITALPLKVVYNADEDLNLNGLAVKGVYSDGTEKLVPQGAWDIGEYDNTQAGIQTLTVTVGGKSATFEVEVKAVTLTRLQIVREPDKTSYLKDEDLDLTGILVEGTYSDGTEKLVPESDCTATGYDKSRAGSQTVIITVGRKTATFTVEVKALTSLTLVKSPIKTSYLKGEDLDLTGLLVEGRYSDGSTKIETVNMEDIIGYDKNKTGYQSNVYVKIGDKITSTFSVTVTEAASLSLNIGLPQDNSGDIEIYGLPAAGDIELSVDGRDSKPKMVVISVGALDSMYSSNVYSSISWYINNDYQYSWANSNIVTIRASTTSLTLNKTHVLTVVVIKDGVEYSRTIPFKIVK